MLIIQTLPNFWKITYSIEFGHWLLTYLDSQCTICYVVNIVISPALVLLLGDVAHLPCPMYDHQMVWFL